MKHSGRLQALQFYQPIKLEKGSESSMVNDKWVVMESLA